MRPSRYLPDTTPAWRPVAAAILLFVAALMIRLPGIGQESLWLDEGVSYSFASSTTLRAMMLGDVQRSPHPPLYHLLLRLWMQLSGFSPLHARLLSAVLGAAAIPLLYILGRELVGEKGAILSALLLMVSPFHVHFSQEVRMYGLLCTEAILAMLLLARLLRRASWTTTFALALVNAAGLATHLSYVLILVTLAVSAAFLRRNRRFLILSIGLPLVLLALIRGALPHQLSVLSYPARTGFGDMLTALRELLWLTAWWQPLPAPWKTLYLVGAILAMLLGARALLRERRLWVALFLLVPLFAYKFLELLMGPLLPFAISGRHVIIILPAMVLLMAKGAANARPMLSAALLAILLVPALLSLGVMGRLPEREDWAGAAAALQDARNAEFPIVVFPPFTEAPLAPYLKNSDRLFARWDGIWSVATLPDEFLLVTSRYESIADPDHFFLGAALSRYHANESREFFGGIWVMRLERSGRE